MEEIIVIVENDSYGQVSQYVKDNIPLIKFLAGKGQTDVKTFLERAVTKLVFSYDEVMEPNKFG